MEEKISKKELIYGIIGAVSFWFIMSFCAIIG